MPANTGQTGPDNSWLATLAEDVLEPELPIIDPHHHLWRRNGYTYLMPELAEDLASGHNVIATVYAECHSMYRELGAGRSMYDSNFPVQKRWCSYQVCWNAFKRISSGASAAEKAELFAGSAAKAYRIDIDSTPDSDNNHGNQRKQTQALEGIG